MNASVQTIWHKPGQQPKPGRKTNRVAGKPVDPDTLTLCNDPLPSHRARPGCKYAAVFGTMKPGQAIKCGPDDVNRIANALRKHIETHAATLAGCLVRSIRDYGDGLGRVWLVGAPKPAAKVAANVTANVTANAARAGK